MHRVHKYRLGEKSLSYLMKISIESPEKLNDEDLKMMIEKGIEKLQGLLCN